MYSIPNFASLGSSGGSDSIIDIGTMNIDSMGGQNQYTNYPSMSSSTSSYPLPTTSPSTGYQQNPNYPPGVVPPSGSPVTTNPASYPTYAGKKGSYSLPGGANTVPSQDPQFTAAWNQYLQSQMGQGVTPFDLSALLPSTGEATTPGTLTAPENPLMKQLQDFFMGQGTGVSGTMTPGGTATGGPLSYVLPMWQSEVSAMNQPIQQQMANIKEQFGSQGALGSSEMAQAMANYGQQTALSEESLLGQLTMQALPQEMQMSQGIQQLDQQSIQNLYNEFIRTQPQYNPLNANMQQTATTYPPIYTKQGGVGSALIGSAGNIMGGLAALLPALGL